MPSQSIYNKETSQKTKPQAPTLSPSTNQKFRTTKTSCVLQSEYKSKSQEQLKKILHKKAKTEALSELYGVMIRSNIEIENGKLTKDEIQQLSLGNVRVKGKPTYFNGKNWGEVCTTIDAYITQEDFAKYQPQNVKLDGFCYNNPSVSTNKIQEKANYKAYKTAIAKFKPSYKNINDTQAESFVHGYSKSNEKFNFKTGVYCFDAVVTLLPYEFELVKKSPKNLYVKPKKRTQRVKKKVAPSQQHGLKVTFYSQNDFELKKPLYKTTLKRNLWLKNRSFLNHKLNSNSVYQVKIDGYMKFEEDVNYLKLISDVYTTNIKIDGKKVLTDRKTTTEVHLKGGQTYKLSMYIKTSNSYDISLLAKNLQSDAYVTVGLKSLYQ